jgi:hypothetical protein
MMQQTKRPAGLWVAMGLVAACGACCALPLLAALGIGAVGSISLATMFDSEWKLFLILLAIAALDALVLLTKRRKARAVKCIDECATDRSCCEKPD